MRKQYIELSKSPMEAGTNCHVGHPLFACGTQSWFCRDACMCETSPVLQWEMFYFSFPVVGTSKVLPLAVVLMVKNVTLFL